MLMVAVVRVQVKIQSSWWLLEPAETEETDPAVRRRLPVIWPAGRLCSKAPHSLVPSIHPIHFLSLSLFPLFFCNFIRLSPRVSEQKEWCHFLLVPRPFAQSAQPWPGFFLSNSVEYNRSSHWDKKCFSSPVKPLFLCQFNIQRDLFSTIKRVCEVYYHLSFISFFPLILSESDD